MDLSAEEGRVLGCLVEKALTTPQYYPLTENAVVAACNQATNRDPVTAYDRETVRRTLLSLRDRGLARFVRQPGDRSTKHRHLLDEAMGLEVADQALLCVLLVRGAQTVGELRTRTERLHPFASTAEVEGRLSALAERGLVHRLERRPGQKEARYVQVLAASEASVEAVGRPVEAVGRPVEAVGRPAEAVGRPVETGARTDEARDHDVAALAAEVAALRAEVVDLRAAVERLLEAGRKR